MSLFSKIFGRTAAPEKVRRFEGAGRGRRFSGTSPFGSYRSETSAANPMLRTRARHLTENSPYANNAVQTWAANLIGHGMTCAPKHDDPATRKLLTNTFADWANNCDFEGRSDWAGIQMLIAKGVVRDGEAFLRLVQTDTGLKVQIIPPERVKADSTASNIIDGVEFNEAGNRVAYHVLPNDRATQTVRIDAGDMCHIFAAQSAGQIRGVSWLAPVMLTLTDWDALQDALLMSAKVASLSAGFVRNVGMNNGVPFDGVQTGEKLEVAIEPGTLTVLGDNQDVTFNSPQQLPTAIQFADLTLQSIAAGTGLPVWMLSGDVSKVNYSTARAALIQFRTRVEALQWHTFLPQLIRPVYERVITTAVLSGKLDIPLDEALAFEMYPARMAHLDPAKEAEGEKIAVDSGFKSRRQVVSELGYSIESLDEEIAADKAREKLLGLSFVTVSKSNVPAPQAS